MTRSAARLAAVVMALVLAAAGGARAQVVTWGMANEYPASSIQGEADARFGREVTARSGGRIEIAHQYDASSGFRSKDMVDAIGRGDLRIGNTYMGALGGLDPIFLLPSLPFLATTPEQGQALAAVARPAYERALARHNQVLLFQSPWPAAGIWANRPVDSTEALRGLRVRTADANGVLAFRAAGAVPVVVSFADALPQLRAGQLDAVLSSGDGGAGRRLMETLRHFTAIEYAVTMSMVTINARRLARARALAAGGGAGGGRRDRGPAVGGDEDPRRGELRADARGRRRAHHRALARVPPGAPRGGAGRGGRLAAPDGAGGRADPRRLPGAARRPLISARPTSTTSSTSTETFEGREDRPIAERAWRPASPKSCWSRSEAPLMTVGCAPNSGPTFTKPTTLTTRFTRSSEPTACFTQARQFSIASRAER